MTIPNPASSVAVSTSTSGNPYLLRRQALQEQIRDKVDERADVVPESVPAQIIVPKDDDSAPHGPLRVVIPNLKLAYQERHVSSVLVASDGPDHQNSTIASAPTPAGTATVAPAAPVTMAALTPSPVEQNIVPLPGRTADDAPVPAEQNPVRKHFAQPATTAVAGQQEVAMAGTAATQEAPPAPKVYESPGIIVKRAVVEGYKPPQEEAQNTNGGLLSPKEMAELAPSAGETSSAQPLIQLPTIHRHRPAHRRLWSFRRLRLLCRNRRRAAASRQRPENAARLNATAGCYTRRSCRSTSACIAAA